LPESHTTIRKQQYSQDSEAHLPISLSTVAKHIRSLMLTDYKYVWRCC